MKTIVHELEQRMREMEGFGNYSDDEIIGFVEGFRAGVKFAQQWISIDSELPKDDGWYLCKLDKQTVPETLHFQNPNEWSNTGIKVTHWRPIELK